MSNNHRQIYESHYGVIPKDAHGRSYEIHHIDGDHSNNSLHNLKAVTIEEHYAIHRHQGDHGACVLLLARMNLSVEETSRLQSGYATSNAMARVANGTHHFQTAKHRDITIKRNTDRMEDGTHIFLDPVFQNESKARLKENNSQRLLDGTHNFLDSEFQRRNAASQISRGVHPFQDKEAAVARSKKLFSEGRHPNQVVRVCPHCAKQGVGPGMLRWHFDKCKYK